MPVVLDDPLGTRALPAGLRKLATTLDFPEFSCPVTASMGCLLSFSAVLRLLWVARMSSEMLLCCAASSAFGRSRVFPSSGHWEIH